MSCRESSRKSNRHPVVLGRDTVPSVLEGVLGRSVPSRWEYTDSERWWCFWYELGELRVHGIQSYFVARQVPPGGIIDEAMPETLMRSYKEHDPTRPYVLAVYDVDADGTAPASRVHSMCVGNLSATDRRRVKAAMQRRPSTYWDGHVSHPPTFCFNTEMLDWTGRR